MRVLVLGGTRFFGRRLVELLLDAGHAVSVATRGRAADGLGERVERITVDRDDAEALRAALAAGSWDLVYDQIGYSSRNASALLAALGERTRQLIFTSTGAVYERTGRPLTEPEFDPTSYPIREVGSDDVPYGEGKRLAEAVLFQRAPFPVAALRFPVVIGRNDYTARMTSFIERVRTGQEIRVDDTERLVSYITEDDAARQLLWAGAERWTGPINGSCGPVSVGALLALIEQRVGRRALLSDTADPDTAYGIATSSALSPDRAVTAGFRFRDTLESAIAALCE
jgi:nucleoside-diphosphate-sugar epimerase